MMHHFSQPLNVYFTSFSFMRLFVISLLHLLSYPDEFFQVLSPHRTHVGHTVDRCISFGDKGRKGGKGFNRFVVLMASGAASSGHGPCKLRRPAWSGLSRVTVGQHD